MEKNTIVLDELGNIIGTTYPKRARGLVKSGRAEFVDDCTLRLLYTHASALHSMEEMSMSNKICFNAREFKFDSTCQGNNVGTRLFITDMFGDSTELFEIGDNGGNWTQIACEKTLEPDTDYVFRFGMLRQASFNTYGSRSEFVIMPITGEEGNDEDWENRYVYNLADNMYKPVLLKRWQSSMFTIFEVPFHTDDRAKVRFVFVQCGAPVKILPVKENSAYDILPEYSLGNWVNGKVDMIKDQASKFSMDDAMQGVNQMVQGATETFKSVASKFSQNFFSHGTGKMTVNNERVDGEKLASMLVNLEAGAALEFNNVRFTDSDATIDCGTFQDSLELTFNNCRIGGRCFVGILQKIDCGCKVIFRNVKIDAIEGETPALCNVADNSTFEFANCSISRTAAAALMKIAGDGGILKFTNVSFVGEEPACDYGMTVDGLMVEFCNTKVPGEMAEKIRAKFGDGCEIIGA